MCGLCRLLDVKTGTCSLHGHSLVMHRGKITAVDAQQLPPTNAVVINCGGMLVMPGLCDAHVHVTATTANLPGLFRYSRVEGRAQPAALCTS